MNDNNNSNNTKKKNNNNSMDEYDYLFKLREHWSLKTEFWNKLFFPLIFGIIGTLIWQILEQDDYIVSGYITFIALTILVFYIVYWQKMVDTIYSNIKIIFKRMVILEKDNEMEIITPIVYEHLTPNGWKYLAKKYGKKKLTYKEFKTEGGTPIFYDDIILAWDENDKNSDKEFMNIPDSIEQFRMLWIILVSIVIIMVIFYFIAILFF